MAKAKEPTVLPIDKSEEAKLKEFFDKFMILSKEYGYDISAKLELSNDTLKAVPMVVKMKNNESK